MRYVSSPWVRRLAAMVVLVLSCANPGEARAQAFGILRELWTGLSTTDPTLNGLTNSLVNTNWPSKPTALYTKIRTSIETDQNLTNGYGERLRGFIVPPATGRYTFWIASDDNSALFLSPGEDPAAAVPLAWVSGATPPRTWDVEPNQQSALISLQAGRRYYIEVQHKEASGDDNLSVRWQLPSGLYEEPITNTTAGTRLIPFRGTIGTPGIYTQPTNLTVLEGRPTTFVVLSTNQGPVNYQWQLNGVNIPGPEAAGSTYTVPNPTVAGNSGQSYRCVLWTSAGTNTSNGALLTVQPDSVAPTVTNVVSSGLTGVLVTFSEPVTPSSATDASHYAVQPGVPVGAVTQVDAQTVLVETGPLTDGGAYSVVINGIQDLASIPNVIAPGTTIPFVAHALTLVDLGGSVPAGSVTPVAGGWDISGGGSAMRGKADQYQFEYQKRSGDFDLGVRVQGLSGVDLWSRAGLIARENLLPGSRFAGAMASSGISGCYFESRLFSSGLSTATGYLPSAFPDMWLRLRKSGSLLSGYASYDGVNWAPLGQASIGVNTLYVGLGVESHSTNALATARFRDFGPVVNPSPVPVVLPWEPPGPSSRKTGVVISEIHYKPAPRSDTNNVEFIELYNTNPFFEDLGGYQLAGAVSYTFPKGTTLPGAGFLVVAASPAGVQAVYGIPNVTGPYAGSLKSSGTLQLLDATGAVLLEIPYSGAPPWPVGTSGTGHSLVLAQPSYGEADPRAWARSEVVGGSPGGPERYHPDHVRSVRINEFVAHSDGVTDEYVELYNHGGSPVDLSGCVLTDPAGTNTFIFPPGSTLPALGYVAVARPELGFGLPAGGGTLLLWNAPMTALLDAITFEGQAAGVASGRWPDGAADFYPLSHPTPGARNAEIRPSEVVINEIMYKPISNNPDDSYVELFNPGTQAVDLSGWKFTAGPGFTFASGQTLGAGQYLVVARNRTNLFAHYSQLTPANTVGDFTGKIPHGGRLALARPDFVVKTNVHGALSTNRFQVVVDEVTFDTGGRWGQWANGGGSSLELRDPRANRRLAYSWGDSDETAKAPWVTLETYGQMDNGANREGSVAHIQLGILDVGECLVDDVEVRPGQAGANYVRNPGFDSDLTGWQAQGCLLRSSVESGGFQGGKAIHLRCSDRVWTGANSLQGTLTNQSLAEGKMATLRLKARWLRGWPEVLLRLNGNWLELTGTLPVPSNLGTPGQPNSQAVANAGPAIYEVTHTPSLPQAGVTAVVTARFHDPDGLQGATVWYRIDPATSYTPVPMTDDGTAGDAFAGDGLYSGAIPGQSAGTLVAFYIEAFDKAGITNRFPALPNDNSPVPEGLIRFGEKTPSTSFGVYHLWVTKDKSARWAAQPNLSNESWDSTFVYGNRVIYDVMARFSGSPYHQSFSTPDGNPCHYKWTFPDDDKFLGATSFNKIHQPGNGAGDDDTLQREQTGYWILRQMGLPWNYRRLVTVFVNGNQRGSMMEDTQTPDSDVVKEHWPNDSNGWLFKLQPWFEFDPDGVGFNNNSWNTLNIYNTIGGQKKLARYRWNYLMRKTPGSANDYSKVYDLVNAAAIPTSSPAAYAAALESVMDVEQYIRTFAVEHSVGNWDSVGNNNGQNMYGYVGQNTRWNLLVWDLNILLASSTGPDGPTGDDLFKLDGNNPPLAALVAFPKYKRAYWRAYKELAENAYLSTSYSPLMDAKYGAMVADGITASDGTAPSVPTAIKTYMSQRLGYLNSQLATVKATFGLSTNLVVVTNGNLATFTGTAPVDIANLQFNGNEEPIVWITPTTWRLRIPVVPGTNTLQVQGYDRSGNPVAGATATVQIVSTNQPPPAAGVVVLNEVLYNPLVPGESFIELLNTSPDYAYDLAGWRLDGVGYTFPPGSLITNGQFLVIAQDRWVVTSLHGGAATPFDEFPGTLSADGGTIALVQPGATPDQDVIVSRMRYEGRAPWPVAASTGGASLQRIDPLRAGDRVANWTSADVGWKFFSVTATFAVTNLQLWLDAVADLYLDDLTLVPGAVPGVGTNLLRDGDFEGPFTLAAGGPWNLAGNAGINSSPTTDLAHGGSNSLHLVFGVPGSTSQNLAQALPLAATNGPVTLSFWYYPTLAASNLAVRVGPGFRTNVSVRAQLATPGKSNLVVQPLPDFPPLWLNEVVADNQHGLTDATGQRGAWVELVNAGPTPVDLAGYTLSDSYTEPGKWTFPQGASLAAGQYRVVFLDGHPERSTASEWHAAFKAAASTGSVALHRTVDGHPQLVDYLNYDALATDRSYGAYPDAQPFDRALLSVPTPSAPNSPPDRGHRLFINEWMSSNANAVQNAATGKYDDWFEIYNAEPVPVTLSGLYLGSTKANPLDYAIPAGFTLAPGGHLLVWADKGAGAGNVPGVELHTSFKLSKSGGTLGIYEPDGTPIDTVTYAPQGSNQADGRCPDGGPSLLTLQTPTPGAANNCAGLAVPPTLDPIADRVVHRGETLVLAAVGHDWNQPAQALAYSLGARAPAGAVIDPASGLFSWTPPPDAPLGNQLVDIAVTTGTTPPLTATTTFTISVQPALHWDGISVSADGTVHLNFSTIPGKTYRVEYKDHIEDPAWLPLGADSVATGLNTSVPLGSGGSPQRYYRLIQVD